MNDRKPASRHHPYVLGYAPEDLMLEQKTTFYHRLRGEMDQGGPYHQAVERALEIRDDHKAGKPLPPLPRGPAPASEPVAPAPVEEPPVVVTLRVPKALYERLRAYVYVSRKTKQAALLDALERYLDEEESKVVAR